MIELIATMLIIGLVGAIGAVGFSDAIRGYLIAEDSAELAQEAQVVLTKLNVELMHMNATTASSSTAITYQPVFELPPSATTHTFSYNNGTGVLSWDGQTLVDDVSGFSFAYYDDQDDPSPTVGLQPNGTTVIEVSLTLQNAAGGNQTFTQRIFPLIRNVVQQN